MTKRSRPVLIAAALGAILAVGIASRETHASRPVPRQITGCVKQGALVSENGYTIRVFRSGTRERFDLRTYEGRRIRFDGYLLPGDSYFVKSPPTVLGPCAASRQ